MWLYLCMWPVLSFRSSGSNYEVKCFCQLLAWKCLKSVMWLGSILFLNTLTMLTISHAVTNPIGPSRLQVCYACLCDLTMLRVWKIYPKTTVYIEVWTYCIQIAQFTYSASRQWTSSSSRRLVLNSFRKTKSGIWYTWDVHVFSTAPVANQIAGEHLRFCPHSKMKSITNGTGNRFQYIGFSDSRNKRSEIVRPHACF